MVSKRPRDNSPLKSSKKQFPLDLDLEIKDFGPITHGKIKLKPLTIFVGPNNSGKSYTALLTHSIINAQTAIFENWSTAFKKYRSNFIKDLDKLIIQKSFILTPKLINKIVEKSIYDIVENVFLNELERNFLLKFSKLIKFESKSFSLKISSKIINVNIKCHKNKLKIDSIKYPDLKFKINICSNIITNDTYNYKINKNLIIINVLKLSNKIIIETIYDAVYNSAIDYLQKNMSRVSFYSPSMRSSALYNYKFMSTAIIKYNFSDSSFNLNDSSQPGTITDFLSNILTLDENHKSPFFNDVEKLEETILHGKTKVTLNKINSMPEIKFIQKNRSIPIRQVSSSISEFVPFILYLKYVINLDDVLIIDEPEAHLHPHNQILFIKFLVRLIRAGLNIILTTQSPFILEQINNFIKIHKLSEKIRTTKFDLEKNDYLTYNDVSVYGFKQNSPFDNIITKIRISKEHGIPDDEFIDVNKKLYNEFLKIHDHLNGNLVEFQ